MILLINGSRIFLCSLLNDCAVLKWSLKLDMSSSTDHGSCCRPFFVLWNDYSWLLLHLLLLLNCMVLLSMVFNLACLVCLDFINHHDIVVMHFSFNVWSIYCRHMFVHNSVFNYYFYDYYYYYYYFVYLTCCNVYLGQHLSYGFSIVNVFIQNVCT